MKLTDIIKGSEYDLSLFTEAQISELESRIAERQTKKGVEYYITCAVRKKDIKATPEEVVRQLYLLVLTSDLSYPVSRMELEYEVFVGKRNVPILSFLTNSKRQVHTLL